MHGDDSEQGLNQINAELVLYTAWAARLAALLGGMNT